MKLKIAHLESQTEHEADYDTAVDMYHSTILTQDYSLVTPSGLSLQLLYEQVNTSHSYLEPDDDAPGASLVYAIHAAPEKSTCSKDVSIQANLTEKIIILTKEQFHTYFNEYVEKSEEEKYNYRYGNDRLLYQFEQQQKGNVLFDSIDIEVSKEDLIAFRQSIKNQKKYEWFEVDIPPTLMTQIVKFEKEEKERKIFNSSNLIDNMCTQAQARLGVEIEHLADDALEGLKARKYKKT